jgi:hypothetical protein
MTSKQLARRLERPEDRIMPAEEEPLAYVMPPLVRASSAKNIRRTASYS